MSNKVSKAPLCLATLYVLETLVLQCTFLSYNIAFSYFYPTERSETHSLFCGNEEEICVSMPCPIPADRNSVWGCHRQSNSMTLSPQNLFQMSSVLSYLSMFLTKLVVSGALFSLNFQGQTKRENKELKLHLRSVGQVSQV